MVDNYNIQEPFANLLDRDQEVAQESVPFNKQIGLDTNPITLSTGVAQTVAPYTGRLSDTAPKPNIFNVTQPYSNPKDIPKNTNVSQNVANQQVNGGLLQSSKSKKNILLYGGIALGLILLVTIIK
jgi:hypothetical protein